MGLLFLTIFMTKHFVLYSKIKLVSKKHTAKINNYKALSVNIAGIRATGTTPTASLRINVNREIRPTANFCTAEHYKLETSNRDPYCFH